MSDKFWTHLKLKNGDKVKFVPPAPNGDQLGGVTQSEREQIGQLKEDLSAVPKTVKVAGTALTMDADGAVDIPLATDIYQENRTPGIVMAARYGNDGIGISSAGSLYVYRATEDNIDKRGTNIATSNSRPIVPNNLDYAVKAAMTDGKGTAWTADEQKAARKRMSADGGAWGLLFDQTLTEDVSQIQISNISARDVVVICENNELISSITPFAIGIKKGSNTTFTAFATNNAKGKKRYAVYLTALDDTISYAIGSECSNTFNNNVMSQISCDENFTQHEITYLSIGSYIWDNSGKYGGEIKSGTRVRVWGR